MESVLCFRITLVRIPLFTLIRSLSWGSGSGLNFDFDVDPDPVPPQSDANSRPLVYRSFIRLHFELLWASTALNRSSILSHHSYWMLTLMRIRILNLCADPCGSGSATLLGTVSTNRAVVVLMTETYILCTRMFGAGYASKKAHLRELGGECVENFMPTSSHIRR